MYQYDLPDMEGNTHAVLVDDMSDLVGVKLYKLSHAQKYVYISKTTYRKNETLHQHIMGVAPHNKVIDHIDNNPLNNQRSNLRFVTTTENSWNVPARPRKNRGYIGILRKGRKWHARMRIKGKVIDIARHNLDKTAATFRDKAVELVQGQFAVFNFPERDRSLDTFPHMQEFIDKYCK